ncbi:MAG: NAD(P)H-dependent oxidoreductase [Proteobacteria bacterium]|nr:NAD(P)H-dependent oxidoreductase [Pseudomonadota bacterium]
MASVLIAFYSRSGNTEKMAEAVAMGARQVSGVEVEVRPVAEVGPDDLLKPEGIIMGSPVYYGTMAAELKTLIDESVKHHGKLIGKVGGAFASSGGPGGGNETTVLDIVKALLIHGMIVQGDAQGDHYGAIAVGAPDDRSRKECEKLGRRVAELAVKLTS